MMAKCVRFHRARWYALGILWFLSEPVLAQETTGFDSYEIRVIRPKYFTKAGRVSLGAQMDTIMNQSFIYSLMATGILSHHFSESLGVELRGSYGTSIDKDDKRLLADEFQISTIILRTFSALSLRLGWTPLYGKFQLASGKIVYFDTYVSAGGGLTGVEYLFDHCRDPGDLSEEVAATREEPPQRSTRQYPTLVAGIGQRFFLSRTTAIRMGIDYHQFQYDLADGSCQPSQALSVPRSHNNILLGLGASTWY